MTSPIRVLIVDDHLLVRRGLATLLLAFNDITLVGEAQSGAEALEQCATARPHVILMDLIMSELDGAAATRAICERYPDIRVIILAVFEEYELIRRALRGGASGMLLKNMSGDDLAVNIRLVHAQRPVQTLKLVEALARAVPLLTPPPIDGADLTEREHEVLGLMAHGFTNPQIGNELVISRATAKAHVSSILSKLGVATRTEAVALAMQCHLTHGAV